MNLKVKDARSSDLLNQGLLFGTTAYFIWGVVPVYWPHLQPATPLEILCHRILWSLAFLLVIGRKQLPKVKMALQDSRTVRLLLLASALISVNWGLFIWASVTKHLLDSSLGYFITPLLSVALGVVIFKEKLRKLQWLAVAIASLAVCYLSILLSAPPWLALALALSFGLYGYIKKLANVPAIESLSIETLFLSPMALGYLIWLEFSGTGTFAHHGVQHSLWLASSGIVTAVPLLLFTAAAIRVPLTTMGMLQYLGPTLQYLIGVWVFHESMPSSRFIGFAITWFAIGIFTFDALSNRKLNTN